MSSITLELVHSSDTVDQLYLSFPLAAHVHKRFETFKYVDELGNGDVPLDHVLNDSIKSSESLTINDLSSSFPQNSSFLLSLISPLKVIYGKTLTLPNSKILATNKLLVNRFGKLEPFFYKIVLPEGTQSVYVQVLRKGILTPNPDGFIVDLANEVIWTNKQNYYNAETGDYEIFFINAVGETETIRDIATIEPVAREATWEDIDLDTGMLREDIEIYTKETFDDHTLFTFAYSDRWYVKITEDSLIKCKNPLGYFSNENWFLRITNGAFSQNRWGESFYYRLPEYEYQNFIPYKPYRWSFYEQVYLVERNILKLPANKIFVDSSASINLTLYVYDSQDNLLRVITTNESLNGTNYSDTSILYEYGNIISISEDGFLLLNFNLETSHKIYADYYFEEESLEYTGLNLNPILNKDVINSTVVFYIIPNVTSTEQALHHMILDKNGTIISCSQRLSTSYDNFQLLNSDGSYNAGTLIGGSFVDDFLEVYTANYLNSYGYLILAYIGVAPDLNEDRFLVTDVKRKGGLDPDNLEEIFARNYMLKYSGGFEEEGEKLVPENATLVVELPVTLLTEYGGSLTVEKAEELSRKYIPFGIHRIVEWTFPYCDYTVTVGETDIVIEMDDVGSYTYTLYSSVDGVSWVLLDSDTAAFTFTDTVDPETLYWYKVTLADTVEYPAKYITQVRSR